MPEGLCGSTTARLGNGPARLRLGVRDPGVPVGLGPTCRGVPGMVNTAEVGAGAGYRVINTAPSSLVGVGSINPSMKDSKMGTALETAKSQIFRPQCCVDDTESIALTNFPDIIQN